MCLGYSGVYWEPDGYLSIYSEQGRENSPSTQCVVLSLVLKGTGSGVCLDLQTYHYHLWGHGKVN